MPDLRVTARFGAIHVHRDGEDGSSLGEFRFEFGVLRPDSNNQYVYGFSGRDGFDVPPCNGRDNDGEVKICRVDSQTIRVQSGFTLMTSRDHLANAGGISTTEAQFERFVVSGKIEEFEGSTVDCVIRFPDSFAAPEDSGIVQGPNLRPGMVTMNMHRIFACLGDSLETLEITLRVAYIAA